MPAYNFKNQFAAKVASGVKPFTIRKKRKRPTVKGDILYLYVGMRVPGGKTKLLKETTAKEVIPIRITASDIYLDGVALFESMKHGFAVLDGFNDYKDFLEFHKPNFNSDELEMIVWDEKHAIEIVKYINRNRKK